MQKKVTFWDIFLGSHRYGVMNTGLIMAGIIPYPLKVNAIFTKVQITKWREFPEFHRG